MSVNQFPMKSTRPFSSFPVRRRRAFSLLEMIVVLGIIGLLAGLVVSNISKFFGQSQGDVAKIFVTQSLKTPLVRYRIDMGDYPSTAEGLAALVTAPGSNAEKWRGPYLDVAGGKLPNDPFGQPYEYRYPGVKNVGGYDLYSKGVDKTAETADDIGNW